MTAGKRMCLMIGGSQVFTANENFNAGRFWMGVFNVAVVGVLLWASRPASAGGDGRG